MRNFSRARNFPKNSKRYYLQCKILLSQSIVIVVFFYNFVIFPLYFFRLSPTTARISTTIRWLWCRRSRGQRFSIQRRQHSKRIYSKSLRYFDGINKIWSPLSWAQRIHCWLFISFSDSTECIIGIYLLVRVSCWNESVFAKPSWTIVGCYCRTLCHHDCNGLLRKCSPYIAHEFHISRTLYIGGIVYAWHIDFNRSTKHRTTGGWCNGCIVSCIDPICAANEIRFHCLQWRSIRGHDSVHDFWHRNDILEWSHHSPGLRLHRCTPLQYLLDIRVSIRSNMKWNKN